MTALDDNTLRFPASRSLPRSALSFIGLVVRGRYRFWLMTLVSGEALNALCGILLPYALNRIITTITTSHAEPRAVLPLLIHPLALFACDQPRLHSRGAAPLGTAQGCDRCWHR